MKRPFETNEISVALPGHGRGRLHDGAGPAAPVTRRGERETALDGPHTDTWSRASPRRRPDRVAPTRRRPRPRRGRAGHPVTAEEERTTGARRRPLLKAVVGGALGVGALATASRLALQDDSTDAAAGLSSPTAGSDVRALEVRLGDDLLPRVGGRRWGSTRAADLDPLDGRLHLGGRRLRAAEGAGQVPGPGRLDRLAAVRALPRPAPTPARRGRDVLGTELVWIGDADGIQVRVTGARPADLTMVLLHPARRLGDRLSSAPAGGPAAYAPQRRCAADADRAPDRSTPARGLGRRRELAQTAARASTAPSSRCTSTTRSTATTTARPTSRR